MAQVYLLIKAILSNTSQGISNLSSQMLLTSEESVLRPPGNPRVQPELTAQSGILLANQHFNIVHEMFYSTSCWNACFNVGVTSSLTLPPWAMQFCVQSVTHWSFSERSIPQICLTRCYSVYFSYTQNLKSHLK